MTAKRRRNFDLLTTADWKPLLPGEPFCLLGEFAEHYARHGMGHTCWGSRIQAEDDRYNAIWNIQHYTDDERGFAVVVRRDYTRTLIRIADYWTATGDAAPDSRKLNCGVIHTCCWRVPTATADHLFEWGKSKRTMLAAKISYDQLQWAKITDAEIGAWAIGRFDAV